MKRGMRLAWGLLASAAVAAMTACGSRDAGDMDKTAAGTTGQMQSEEAETAVSEEEALEDRMLTVAAFEDTGTLNPYTGESPAYALDWVYEGLTAMENGVPVPELAREWEISGDGLTYTFHLRPDVNFPTGARLQRKMPKEIWIWSWDTGNIIHICRPWRRSALWRPQTRRRLRYI